MSHNNPRNPVPVDQDIREDPRPIREQNAGSADYGHAEEGELGPDLLRETEAFRQGAAAIVVHT